MVIIGGGAVGTSIAYHLAKQSCTSVLLLEMAELTSGSTWHAAGLVPSYHHLANVKHVHQYSLDLFSGLERETGQAINYHNTGSLRVATTDERAEEMRYQVSRNRTKGGSTILLTPDEIVHRCPLLRKDKVKLGLFSADGHLDPYSLTQAYAKGAVKYGATIRQGVRVTGLEQPSGPSGSWRVVTSHGPVTAEAVVNAAGFYAREVGQLSGCWLPLAAVEHQYIVTGPLPDVQRLKRKIPVIRLMEASSYIRLEQDRLLVGVYEAPEKMKLANKWLKNGVPQDFTKELFEPDLERSESYMAAVMDVMPCLQSAPVQSVVNGPITYTPDGLPLLGPHQMSGMWIAAGFSFGILHSGGAGKYLADYIMTGEPPFELSEFDPGRFQESWVTDAYISEAVKEAFGSAYGAHYPYEETYAGRPTSRVTPAKPLQEERGAYFMTHCGWGQPAWFGTPQTPAEHEPSFRRPHWHKAVMEERRHVLEAAGLVDLSPVAKVIIRGGEAQHFLARVTANTVPREGRCVLSHALTTRGTVLAEVTLSCIAPDAFMMVTSAASEIHDLRWFQHKARQWGFANVSFTNVTEEFGCLSIAGPRAREIMEAASEDFPNNFAWFTSRDVYIGDQSVKALRLSHTGEDGWELYLPREQIGRLYQTLLAAGEPRGLKDIGTHALNILRLEKGFRRWGTEMNVETTAVEAGILPHINLEKGEFEGRAAVLQQLQQLPQRQLVQVSLVCPDLDPQGDDAIWSCGAVVGATTSGGFSPALGRSLAFCYLPPRLTVPGTEVEVEILSMLHTATVLPAPPVEAYSKRMARL